MKSRSFGRKSPVPNLQNATRRMLAREIARMERIQVGETARGERPSPEDTEQMCTLARAVATLTDAMRKREAWEKERDSDMTMDEKVLATIELLRDLPAARRAEVLAALEDARVDA